MSEKGASIVTRNTFLGVIFMFHLNSFCPTSFLFQIFIKRNKNWNSNLNHIQQPLFHAFNFLVLVLMPRILRFSHIPIPCKL